MSKVIPEPYYKCDICDRTADRHFKVKVPVPETKLKKWKRFDMCTRCYIEFCRKCKFDIDEEFANNDESDKPKLYTRAVEGNKIYETFWHK